MTKQEAFDRALAGLRQQGCKATEPNEDSEDSERCLYLSASGLRCAFGWLGTKIQARKWAKQNLTASHHAKDIDLDSRFATELQGGLHDNLPSCDFPEALEAAAHRFAKSHKLQFSERPA